MKKIILLAIVIAVTIGFAASWASQVAVSFNEKAALLKKDMPMGVAPAPDPSVILQGGDNVATATVIPSLPYTDAGTTVGYTNDYDETCPYSGGTAPDVVYSFTAVVDSYIVANICNSDFDTKMYVYEGSVTPGSPLACNDDACGSDGYKSQLPRMRVLAGQIYYIIVDGYGTSSAGNYELVVDYTTPPALPPANDDCANAIMISPLPATVSGTTDGATIDCPGGLDWNAVWYKFNAPNAQNNVTVSYCQTATSIPTVGIVLYAACPTTALECTTTFIQATTYQFITCPSTLTNPTMTWTNLPGPATYYFPAYVGSTGIPFVFDISVSIYVPPVPDYAITLPAQLPYSDLGKTTCGMTNEFSNTCLGYYDSGPDAVYQITLTTPICLEFILDSDSAYAGMALSDHFPIDSSCIAIATRSSIGQLLISGQNLAAGTYYLMIDSWSPGPVCIDYDLSIRDCTPPPPNDNCANAQVVGNVMNLPFSTSRATHDNDSTCMYSPNLWYLYTATSNATVTVDLCGSSFDTKLAVYDGSSCSPKPALLFCNDDSCGLQSGGRFAGVSGNSYLIEVGGYGANSGDGFLTIQAGDPVFGVTPLAITGAAPLNGSDSDTLTVTNTGTAGLAFTVTGNQDPFLRLSLEARLASLKGLSKASTASNQLTKPTPAVNAPGYTGITTKKEKPVNFENKINTPDPSVILQGGDNIATATVIPSLPYTDAGTTAGYTNDYDELCTSASTSPDVVYSYFAVEDTYVVVDLCNSLYDTKVFVYAGSYTPGAPYACNDDACGDDGWKSLIPRMQVLAGQTYYIVVDGYGGDFGDYTLSVDYTTAPPPPPANDECADAITIPSFPATVSGTTDGATIDCPGGLDWNAVWYKFDAPYAQNNVSLDYCPGTFSIPTISIILYAACPTTALECTTTFILATNYQWVTCPSGLTNPTMNWTNLPGPATYYLPVYVGAAGGDFTFDINVTNYEPCVITCPPGAINEVELCGEDLNGGCGGAPPTMQFEPVSAGQTICGTSWADASSRDTDWYIFTTEHAVTINLTGKAEFPYALYVINPGDPATCGDETVIASGTSAPCSTNTVSISVPAGTWYIWAGSNGIYTGFPCGGTGTYTNSYYFTLTTTPVWLSLGASSGTIPPGGAAVKVPVLMDGNGLAAGIYTGNVMFTSNDPLNPAVDVPVTFTVGGTGCDYMLGDVNGNGNVIGSDVTYAVRYFKGLGTVPPDSCYDIRVITPSHWLYVGGDVNASCTFAGSDVTRLVSFFKGISVLQNCAYFPPPLAKPTPILKQELGQ
jgi:hypothetical protein